jgi:acyl phosphate:glycerol-3-phosphate acyltransferase
MPERGGFHDVTDYHSYLYLLGSIPTGLIVGQRLGIDVRQSGSGKTGATNMLRNAGWGAAIIVAMGDVVKGILPVLLAQHILTPPDAFVPANASASAWIAGLAGLAAIAGHNYPIYAGFKGGRGVATTGGVALALAFPAAMFAAFFLFIPIILTRYVSLGSMLGALSLPLFEFLLTLTGIFGISRASGMPTAAILLIAAITIVYSHRDNIQRLISGTERRIGEKARPTLA